MREAIVSQLGRPGDFLVGDTAFHVTVAPMPAVYEKCKRNIEDGFRVYLLVPDRSLIGAKQNAETVAPGKITVESIEPFVGQNIEELSVFSKTLLPFWGQRCQPRRHKHSVFLKYMTYFILHVLQLRYNKNQSKELKG
ncbi:DUF4928 family protein [Pelotomaculum sp. FP]|uniref:DUF4928 family protein n=1 Tax=Pelotomaculum sp. FP TaxID=261474 RepID=UPI001066197C|nr:DUF4928 family protein [Pelotomaculum sp. FP]